jgi:hypothetical protein
MAKSSSKGTQQGTSAPWSPQQPFIMAGLNQAKANLGRPTVAPLSSQTTQGLGMIENAAQNSTIPQAAQSQLEGTLGGNYLSGDQSWMNSITPPAPSTGSKNSNLSGATGMEYLNPYIGALQKSAMHTVYPMVNSEFGTAGRTGSSPLAQGAKAEGVASVMAPYLFGSAENQMGRLYSGYQSERDRQLGAVGMAPGTEQLQYAPGEAMLGAGSVYDQQNQALADEPWKNLSNYMNVVGQPFGQQTTGSFAQSGKSFDPMGNALRVVGK